MPICYVWQSGACQRYQEWAANPSPLVQRLRAVKAQRAKEQVEH